MRAKDFYQLIFTDISDILHDEKEWHPTTQIIFRHFIADEFALFLNKDVVAPPEEDLQEIFNRLRQDEPIQYILQEAFARSIGVVEDPTAGFCCNTSFQFARYETHQ